MTVRELIDSLLGIGPEREVIIASDEEGNDFHAADEVSIGWFRKEGRNYERYFDDDDVDSDDVEPGENDIEAVCIWP